MAFHPSSEKTIICAGDEYGNIGFWNVVSGGICRDFYRPHTGMDPLRSGMGGGGGEVRITPWLGHSLVTVGQEHRHQCSLECARYMLIDRKIGNPPPPPSCASSKSTPSYTYYYHAYLQHDNHHNYSKLTQPLGLTKYSVVGMVWYCRLWYVIQLTPLGLFSGRLHQLNLTYF